MTLSIDDEPNAVRVSKTAKAITTITLSRKYRRNAVDGPTARKLYDAFIDFENDSTQKVCILYGDHGTFCAGFDLHTLSTKTASSASDASHSPVTNPDHSVRSRTIGPMGPSRLIPRKSVISAVAGYAVAGGLELSLSGDTRVAEEDAVFGVFLPALGRSTR